MALSRKKQLLSMKYNQRSQMQIRFTEVGKCGHKGRLWESLSKEERTTIRAKDPEWALEDPDGEHHLYWVAPPSMVLVIKKYRDLSVSKKFKELTAWLVEKRNLSVTVEPSVLLEKEITAEGFKAVKDSFITWNEDIPGHKESVLGEIDLIICVGGDGTLLYTSSMFQENFPPIMSFHMGSLGFLTPFQFTSSGGELQEEEKVYQKYIDKVLKGGVSLTLRQRLECSINTEDSVSTIDQEDLCPVSPVEKPAIRFTPTMLPSQERDSWKREKESVKRMLVMNDLVVDRGPNPYLTNLLIKCNGRTMTTVQGDGVIIATPTGSTAYSLAAGASMVHPSVPSMIVTPICPHSLSFRSIVVPSGVELQIMLNQSSRNSAWVSFDGRNRQEIRKGETVVISTCKWPIPSINNTGHVTDWFDSLAECLNWNVRKEQKKLDPA